MEHQIDMEKVRHASAVISREFFYSIKKHDPTFNTTHEAYAVLKEELEELWEDIKRDNWENMEAECAQIGAMAMKLLYSLPDIIKKYEEKGHTKRGRHD